jgi:hypothetical protein
MSEMYEGVVFRSNERTARRVFGSLAAGLRLRLVRLARGVFGIYRVAGRADTFDQPAVERVAQRISTETGSAVALFYDNRCGIRAGVLHSVGRRGREFGEADAWWAPCGKNGELVIGGPQFRLTQLQPGGEYECVFSAIDAALGAVGVGRRVSAELVKQAFCYEELEALAESGSPANRNDVPCSSTPLRQGSAPLVAPVFTEGLTRRSARCAARGRGCR